MVGCVRECFSVFFGGCSKCFCVLCVCGKTTELEKQRLAHKLERWGVYPVCILKEVATGNLEVWFCNKNHASWGLKYKNTHLEFASSLGGK